MKPKIIQRLSKYNQTSRQGTKIKYIVIHYVGAISSALNNCKYFAGGNRNASAHFFCDADIYQSIPLEKSAWHCGGGLQDTGTRMVGGNKGASLHGVCKNANSIGIELCCEKSEKGIVPSETAIKTAIPLVKWLMAEYDIPASRVIRHFDVTGKHCPNGYISKTAWSGLHKRLTSGAVIDQAKYTPAVPTITLRKGSTGEQVKRLQRCLNFIMNENLAIDGSFGKQTERVLKALQFKYGLVVDGSCGPKTRQKLIDVLKKGNK